MTREIRKMAAGALLWSFGTGLFLFHWPVHLWRRLGATSFDVGIVFAAFFACNMAGFLLTGWLADRWNRVRLIRLLWALAIPVPVILGLARSWLHVLWAVPPLALTCASLPVINAYIHGAIPARHRASSFAFYGAMTAAGLIVSPALGGLLYEKSGMAWVCAASLLFHLASMVPVLLLAPEGVRPAAAPALEEEEGGDAPPMLPYLLLAMTAIVAATASQVTLPLYAKQVLRFDDAWIGISGSLVYLGASLILFAFSQRGGSLPPLQVLAGLVCALAVADLLFLAAPPRGLLAVAFGLRGAHQGLISVSMAYAHRIILGRRTGLRFGAFNLGLGLALAAGSLLGGALFHGRPWLPSASSLLALAALAAVILTNPRVRGILDALRLADDGPADPATAAPSPLEMPEPAQRP